MSNDSAVTPDDIHYKLFTNLQESSLTLLLAVFNSILESEISALLDRSHHSCNTKIR